MVSNTMFQVGTEIPPLAQTVTRQLVDEFGALANDFNPIHFDDEFARKRGFRCSIAHGAIAASFLVNMMTRWLKTWPVQNDQINITFVAPVLVGDHVTARGTVEQVSAESVVCDLWCENQDGKRVIVGKAHVTLARP